MYDRTHTGRGRFIDVSMYDSMVALAERSVTAFSLTGRVLERGNEPYMAPWGPFQTADGWVALIVATERDWGKFCEAIERPDLIDIDGTRSGPDRAANMDGWLGDVIRSWFERLPTNAAIERLLAAGLPIGPVQDAREVFECPHQLENRVSPHPHPGVPNPRALRASSWARSYAASRLAAITNNAGPATWPA